MPESERLIRFELLGQEFSFYTGASEEEMDNILSFVRKIIEDNSSGRGGTIPMGKVAVMASLNIASRYVQLKKDFDQYREDTERRIGRMNDEISSRLEAEKR